MLHNISSNLIIFFTSDRLRFMIREMLHKNRFDFCLVKILGMGGYEQECRANLGSSVKINKKFGHQIGGQFCHRDGQGLF